MHVRPEGEEEQWVRCRNNNGLLSSSRENGTTLDNVVPCRKSGMRGRGVGCVLWDKIWHSFSLSLKKMGYFLQKSYSFRWKLKNMWKRKFEFKKKSLFCKSIQRKANKMSLTNFFIVHSVTYFPSFSFSWVLVTSLRVGKKNYFQLTVNMKSLRETMSRMCVPKEFHFNVCNSLLEWQLY